MKRSTWVLLVLVLATQCFAVRRTVYRVFPPSHVSQIAQNVEIDFLGLPRIEDDRQLAQMIEAGELIEIEESKFLKIAANLPHDRRYCKAWTRAFLYDMSTAFYLDFGKPLQVNSAVRTKKVQRNLRRWNRNAAPVHGDAASSHLAGLTVDIARRGLTRDEIKWIEAYLTALDNQVIVIEEVHQPCFHICVRGNYGSFKQVIANEQSIR